MGGGNDEEFVVPGCSAIAMVIVISVIVWIFGIHDKVTWESFITWLRWWESCGGTGCGW